MTKREAKIEALRVAAAMMSADPGFDPEDCQPADYKRLMAACAEVAEELRRRADRLEAAR